MAERSLTDSKLSAGECSSRQSRIHTHTSHFRLRFPVDFRRLLLVFFLFLCSSFVCLGSWDVFQRSVCTWAHGAKSTIASLPLLLISMSRCNSGRLLFHSSKFQPTSAHIVQILSETRLAFKCASLPWVCVNINECLPTHTCTRSHYYWGQVQMFTKWRWVCSLSLSAKTQTRPRIIKSLNWNKQRHERKGKTTTTTTATIPSSSSVRDFPFHPA